MSPPKPDKLAAKRDARAKAARARAKAKADAATAKTDKREQGRRAGMALREAIATALGQDTELSAELEDTKRRAGGKAGAAFLLQAADALEPVLADAVDKKPSFLGRLAYGTAQLVSALATDDEASSR